MSQGNLVFTILEKSSAIQKGIWLHKGENSRKKSKISYFKILAKKLFYNKRVIKTFLKNEKAITYYGYVMKNQVAWMKKR